MTEDKDTPKGFNINMTEHKDNPNRSKAPGRKRKIVRTMILSLTLVFGKARVSSSQSPNSNFDNQIIDERVINDRDVNSFEDNDRQVLLDKAEGNPFTPFTPPTYRGPSNFPTPPSGDRPSQPVDLWQKIIKKIYELLFFRDYLPKIH